ncbi:MAG: metallophosphoesterase [Paludibacteraceae bacterium]|nr:metallophosphoesterase [Paludibacteraceae bacterium]
MLRIKKSYLLTLFTTILSLCCAQSNTHFALLTDTHICHRHPENTEHLQQLVKLINTTEVDFIVVTGDITQNADSLSLLVAKHTLDLLKKPYYVIAGNHDFHQGNTQIFKQIFGDDRFHFQHNGVNFIGCSATPVTGTSAGYIQDTTWTWINKQLEPNKTNLLFTHYPLLPGDIINPEETANRLQQHNVMLILSGHYHRYMLTSCGNIPNIIHRAPQRTGDTTIAYTRYELSNDTIQIYEHIHGNAPTLWLTLPLQIK